MDIPFSTPIAEQQSFGVRQKPDHVVGRCEVRDVEVRSDGVALILTRKGYEPIARLRESLAETRPGRLAMLRLGGEGPFAVLQAEDLRRRLPLFDFESEAQMEKFVRDLGASETAVSRASPPDIDTPEESEEAHEARALLEELQREGPILDQLRGLTGSDDDDEVVKGVLDQLERSRDEG